MADKMTNLTINQRVFHDFSRIHGEILDIRNDSQGYNYLVRWDGEQRANWYKRNVLVGIGE